MTLGDGMILEVPDALEQELNPWLAAETRFNEAADLLNLDKINGLGAPVASIGGAGTFDGIFLTGILAVLLAGIASPSPPRPAW